ncbi:hypothetical protein BDF20DRAFT_651412 [Mycotypha africana]|uniref:uncharacterized protein n=1 Tax=Mycotypha africana TaxID=64632 RepID=UPI002300E626|nr:uncharacterized protein BDF20DRAFT_651412 [Mycotypha africana]KAI8973436.1 hypothetical protein BDF20DRAFT_651412 [Mycotypha africana]
MTNMFYSKAFLSNNNDDAEEEWFLSQLDKMSTTETPLSPPLGKKERAQTTRPYGTNGRTLSFSGAFSCANNKGWHSLWSNPTWQTSNDASSDNSSQRTRSVSALQLPSISNLSLYNNISSATTAAVDDYFGNHDSTNTATISSACTLTHDFNKSAFPSPLSTGTTVHAACTPAAAIGTAPMTDNRQNNENNNIITANYLYNLKLNGNNDRLCWSVDSIPSHPLKSTLNRRTQAFDCCHPSL